MKQEVEVTLTLEASTDISKEMLQEIITKALLTKTSSNSLELLTISVKEEAEIYNNE